MGQNCTLKKSENDKYHRQIQNKFNNSLAENCTFNFRSF